jgi:hypothetical protein
MFEPRIRVPRELYGRLESLAVRKGYASVEEFILHLLEQGAAEVQAPVAEEEVRKRLKGLGYLE